MSFAAQLARKHRDPQRERSPFVIDDAAHRSREQRSMSSGAREQLARRAFQAASRCRSRPRTRPSLDLHRGEMPVVEQCECAEIVRVRGCRSVRIANTELVALILSVRIRDIRSQNISTLGDFPRYAQGPSPMRAGGGSPIVTPPERTVDSVLDSACKQVRSQGESGQPAAWRSRRYSAVPFRSRRCGPLFSGFCARREACTPAFASSLDQSSLNPHLTQRGVPAGMNSIGNTSARNSASTRSPRKPS